VLFGSAQINFALCTYGVKMMVPAYLLVICLCSMWRAEPHVPLIKRMLCWIRSLPTLLTCNRMGVPSFFRWLVRSYPACNKNHKRWTMFNHYFSLSYAGWESRHSFAGLSGAILLALATSTANRLSLFSLIKCFY
jgi:hypothetical protein